MKRKWISFIIIITITLTIFAEEQIKRLAYPGTQKVNQVDDYFGVKVKDPYRWLENDTDPKVKDWVNAQNRVTDSYLSKIPFRKKIKSRIKEIYNYPRVSSPFRAGDYYFFYKNNGLQNQSVIYFQKGLKGKAKVFLDPNKMSKDGTTIVYISSISKDNKYLTYMISEKGSDWKEIRVMEIATRKELKDRLKWIKMSSVSWYKDGFFYSGFSKPKKGEKLKGINKFQKVYYHKLGTSQRDDKLIHENRDKPFRNFYANVTEDQKYLILYKNEGTYGNEIDIMNLSKQETKFKPLISGFKNNNYIIGHVKGKFICQSDRNAPRKRVVQIDPKNPSQDNWKEIIPQQKIIIQYSSIVGGKLFVTFMKDAASVVYQYDLKGNLEKKIPLPGVGSVYGFYGKMEDKILFYTFTSFTYPSTIYMYDIESGKSSLFHGSEVKFNPDDFVAKQVFYKSKDGTRIPMFIVHKKGLKADSTNPCYLYGYGGFGINMTPYFDTSLIILLENGGIYAMPCLRGGGEYGVEWHKAGMLFKKQNVFDDFIGAAEYLISEKYTSRETLAIAGGSNGGLLVGACMTQRPDLFKVAFPAVGVMDMLRFHKFTIGWNWTVEFGSSEKKEHFKNLYSYSPLHNLKKGVRYPATLVTTSDHDDRVVPAHSFKFIATLQEKHRGENPVLINIQVKSGHGSSNMNKYINKITQQWSFMFYIMGIDVR